MSDALDKIEAIFDLFPLTVFTLSYDGKEQFRFRAFNKFLCNLSGFTTADIIGKTPFDIFPIGTAEIVTRNFESCLNSKRQIQYEELVNFEGQAVWHSTALSPVEDQNGKVVGIVGFCIDVDELKQSEARYAKLLIDLAQINSDLDIVTSTMAHDLRGPLRQTKLVFQMLEEELQSYTPKTRELCDLIDEALTIALDKIDDILKEVRDRPRTGMRLRAQNLGKWCDDMFALFDPTEKLHLARPDTVIECEPIILDVAVRNIADNASRFAKKQIKIDVEEHAGNLSITIADDGPGFANPGFLEKLKKPTPFEQKSATGGLGLASATALIQSRGGNISLNNPPKPYTNSITITVAGRILEQSADRELDQVVGM